MSSRRSFLAAIAGAVAGAAATVRIEDENALTAEQIEELTLP